MGTNEDGFFYWRDLREVFEKIHEDDFRISKFIYNEIGKLDSKMFSAKLTLSFGVIAGLLAGICYLSADELSLVAVLKIFFAGAISIFFFSVACYYWAQHRKLSENLGWLISNDEELTSMLSELLSKDPLMKRDIKKLFSNKHRPSILRVK